MRTFYDIEEDQIRELCKNLEASLISHIQDGVCWTEQNHFTELSDVPIYDSIYDGSTIIIDIGKLAREKAIRFQMEKEQLDRALAKPMKKV